MSTDMSDSFNIVNFGFDILPAGDENTFPIQVKLWSPCPSCHLFILHNTDIIHAPQSLIKPFISRYDNPACRQINPCCESRSTKYNFNKPCTELRFNNLSQVINKDQRDDMRLHKKRYLRSLSRPLNRFYQQNHLF